MGDHKSRWPQGKPQQPSDVYREHFHIVPFYEDDFAELAAAVGVERLLLGSDFPHPEGLAWPAEMADELSAFSPDQVRRIMRGNAAALLGLPA
jgi:predicted TIM-barrel fold metal-dependent hydrolase